MVLPAATAAIRRGGEVLKQGTGLDWTEVSDTALRLVRQVVYGAFLRRGLRWRRLLGPWARCYSRAEERGDGGAACWWCSSCGIGWLARRGKP